MSLTDHLRQPEYTGENRCIPCTAVNVIIATGASVLIAVASTILGAGVFTLSLGVIYLRGYLVPGTPMLTKRYFPERVLRWFDKDSTTPITSKIVEIDPEQELLDAGAVEPCREGADLCLTTDFQRAWCKRIRTTRAHDLSEDNLTDILGVSATDEQITISQQGERFVAYTDGTIIAQWSSQAAVVADIAAATELNERVSNWQNLAPSEIVRVLTSIRIFIEQCPTCNGSVQVEQEVVESCCRSYDVIASACQDFDARLLEMEWNDPGPEDALEQSNQSTQATM